MGVRIPTNPIEKAPFVAYQIEHWAGSTRPGREIAIAGLGCELARLVLKIEDEDLIMPLLFPWNDGSPSTRVLAERVKTLAPDYGQHMGQIVADSIELATRVCDYDRES